MWSLAIAFAGLHHSHQDDAMCPIAREETPGDR